jgi:hypothetical protein
MTTAAKLTAEQIAEKEKALRTLMTNGETNDVQFMEGIESADHRVLISAVSDIGMRGTHAWAESHRTAARSMIDLKLAEQLKAAIEKLDRGTTRLAWIGVAVAVIIAFVGPLFQRWLSQH